MKPSFITMLVVAVVAMHGCAPPVVWETEIPSGFEGSPTYCDLDGDGLREAVVPVAPTDHPELSFLQVVNPLTGEALFRSEDGAASFAYPLCVDVDRDGILDLITGGRTRDIVALSGADGTRLWAASALHPDFPFANTYTAVATRADYFVVTTGGGTPAGEPDRYPGHLLVMGRDGALLAEWEEPNQVEVYSSPAILEREDGTNLIAVGSGGEELAGNLYLLAYDPLSNEIREVAAAPSGCDSGGFISSPTFGDIDGDGEPEVVGTDWCGQVIALSLEGEVLWTATTSHPYTTGNPLLSDLDNDGIFDVVVTSGEFNWSLMETWGNRASSVAALSGLSGEALWNIEVEKYLWASPVSADYNGDFVEDVWVIGADIADDFGTPPPSPLFVLDGRSGETLLSVESFSAMGTPLLDDIDGNGTLDLLIMDAPFSATAFGTGFVPGTLSLIEFPGVPFDAGASFSGFRGPAHDGYRR